MADKVVVSFDYYPDEPDPANATGMSEWEHERLMQTLMEIGADSIELEVIPQADEHKFTKVRKEKKG